MASVPDMHTWPRRTVDANGVAVSYLRSGGDKPPAVMLHGLLGSGATWLPVARLLAQEFDVVLPDARGHGESSRGCEYTYDALAADAVGLIAALELETPVLIGHSMGGLTAAVAAPLVDGLRALVLADPTFLEHDRQREVYDSDVVGEHQRAVSSGRAAMVSEAIARHPRRDRELLALQVDARLATDLAAFEILRPPNPAYRELVAALDVPTLLVVGDRGVVTAEMAAELSPPVQVQVIADAGHGLPFDQPAALARAIVEFGSGR